MCIDQTEYLFLLATLQLHVQYSELLTNLLIYITATVDAGYPDVTLTQKLNVHLVHTYASILIIFCIDICL